MKRREYEAFVNEKAQHFCDENYCIVALNGEAGEVAEWHKKHTLRGNPGGKLSKQDLKEELGDVLWYVTKIATLNGWTLNDIMETNAGKLESRYGTGKAG